MNCAAARLKPSDFEAGQVFRSTRFLNSDLVVSRARASVRRSSRVAKGRRCGGISVACFSLAGRVQTSVSAPVRANHTPISVRRVIRQERSTLGRKREEVVIEMPGSDLRPGQGPRWRQTVNLGSLRAAEHPKLPCQVHRGREVICLREHAVVNSRRSFRGTQPRARVPAHPAI